INSCTDASESQPRSNTKKNRISSAKSVNKKKVAEYPRTNKSSLKTMNRVDSSISFKRTVREEFRDGIGPFNDSGENPPPVTIHTWLERFNKQNPHSFDNAAAPKDAENRISHLEEILMFSRQAFYAKCGRRDSGECRHAARNCFKYGQTGHLQQDDKKDTATSTSGHADKQGNQIYPAVSLQLRRIRPLISQVPSLTHHLS
ncbi:hypothetical protein Tco_0549406, partial [Tanacetum coccineum]